MPNWSRFTPADFEYGFENGELDAHHIAFNEAIECFFSDFEIGATSHIAIAFN